jgi:serpin B
MATSVTKTTSDFEQFGMKIYSTVSQQNNEQNVFLSPASIALAMAMCTAGAKQQTLEQMLRTLNVSSIEQLTQTAEQMMQVFSLASNDKQLKLRLANRLYAQNSYKLRREYLQLVQKSFQADIELKNFQFESAQAVESINAWVETKTERLIRNLLSQDDVKSDTRVILVNCIYFKVVDKKLLVTQSILLSIF